MNSSLAEKLEVWGFEDGKLIFKDLSLGQVLELTPRDVSCATDDFLNSVHSVTCDFLNGLPDGLSLQFVQMIDQGIGELIDKHRGGLDTTAPELARRLLEKRTSRLHYNKTICPKKW
jgi:hypothetical protein